MPSIQKTSWSKHYYWSWYEGL